MISYRPLASLTGQRIERRPFVARMGEVAWIPLADTEILATSHHFPVCVRLDASGLGVGALLDARYLARNLDQSPAAWRSRYVPMTMRAFPFRLTDDPGDTPFDALDVAVDDDGPGQKLAIELFEKGEDGATTTAPSPFLKTAHNVLLRVRGGQAKVAEFANQLLLCEALTTLTLGRASSDSVYLTLDVARFSKLDSRSYWALARTSFAPMDLVGALCFSQRLLRESAIDPATQVAHDIEEQEAPAAAPWMVPWLDMSGLFPADFAGAFPADGGPEDAPMPDAARDS